MKRLFSFRKTLAGIFLAFSLFVVGSHFVRADVMDQIVGDDGKLSSSNNSASIVKDTLNTQRTVPQMVSSIIKIALGLFGTVALIFVIWGGVDWLLSKGDTKKISAARDRMVAAAIGLAIIAASYAITDFIIAQISVVAG